MSLDKAIQRGKEKRSQYRKSKRFDKTCRNHGSCSHCQSDRLHSTKCKEPLPEEPTEDNDEDLQLL